jgi:hypothetical protein
MYQAAQTSRCLRHLEDSIFKSMQLLVTTFTSATYARDARYKIRTAARKLVSKLLNLKVWIPGLIAFTTNIGWRKQLDGQSYNFCGGQPLSARLLDLRFRSAPLRTVRADRRR